MKETENILETAGSTWEYGKKYLENQRDLIKLEVAEKTARLISGFATSMVLGLFVALILVFGSAAAGLWLGQRLDSMVLGFLVVTGFHLVIGLILYVLRKPLITNPTLSIIIKNMFE